MVKRRFDERTVSMANGSATQLAGSNVRRRAVVISPPVGSAGATMTISFKGDATAAIGVAIKEGTPALLFDEETFGDLVHQRVTGFVAAAGVTVEVVEAMDGP